MSASVLGVIAAGLACGPANAADTYAFGINQSASTATFELTVAAPFQTSPSLTSFLIGDHSATNTTGTRTLVGLFGGDNGLNNAINISSGSISASGDNGASPLHPRGSFRLSLFTGPNACAAEGLDLDIFGGGSADIGATLSIMYDTFRTRQPTCTVFGGFPLNVPLGNAVISSVRAVQVGESDAGVMTPAGPGQYLFSIPMDVSVTITATLAGQPLDLAPTVVPIVFGGTVSVNGATATISAQLNIDQSQTEPGPTVLDPVPFVEPLCSGNLLVHITLARTETDVTANTTLVASGDLIPSCSTDYNLDGGGDTADVLDLANDIASGTQSFPPSQPDFNQDGGADLADVLDLANVVAGGECP